MFGEISTSGAAPALEAAMRFASARQKVLSHNIANITTPDFRPSDVSVELVENASAFRVAADLLRSRYQTIAAAISERA